MHTSEINFDLKVLDARIVLDVEDVCPFLDEGATLDDLIGGEVVGVELDLMIWALGVVLRCICTSGHDRHPFREFTNLFASAKVGGDIPPIRWEGKVDEVAVGVAALEEARADGTRQENFLASPSSQS